MNRNITDMLAVYVSADRQDMDAALPFVTFAYNKSWHETAGYTSIFILFG